MNRRVVFDSSVLVRAVMSPQSWSRRSLDIARNEDWMLASEATLAELTEVLLRPKFDRVVDIRLRLAFLKVYASAVQIVPIAHQLRVCRDPRDDMFLDVAANGKAAFIVTGDADLLVLNPFHGITIVSAEAFLGPLSP